MEDDRGGQDKGNSIEVTNSAEGAADPILSSQPNQSTRAAAPTNTGQSEARFSSPTNLIAIASVLLSLIALAVSLRGCQVARDAYTLSQRQYREERLLVLVGTFDEEGTR